MGIISSWKWHFQPGMVFIPSWESHFQLEIESLQPGELFPAENQAAKWFSSWNFHFIFMCLGWNWPLWKSVRWLCCTNVFEPNTLVYRLLSFCKHFLVCTFDPRCTSTTKASKNFAKSEPSYSEFDNLQGECQERKKGKAWTGAEWDEWYHECARVFTHL